MTSAEFTEALDSFYTDGPFRGYEYLGYVGNSDRNYLTDEWVCAGANELGWSVKQLKAWATSVWGRWALDAAPHSAQEMLEEMRRAKVLYAA